jgi:hypothetical protein
MHGRRQLHKLWQAALHKLRQAALHKLRQAEFHKLRQAAFHKLRQAAMHKFSYIRLLWNLVVLHKLRPAALHQLQILCLLLIIQQQLNRRAYAEQGHQHRGMAFVRCFLKYQYDLHCFPLTHTTQMIKSDFELEKHPKSYFELEKVTKSYEKLQKDAEMLKT